MNNLWSLWIFTISLLGLVSGSVTTLKFVPRSQGVNFADVTVLSSVPVSSDIVCVASCEADPQCYSVHFDIGNEFCQILDQNSVLLASMGSAKVLVKECNQGK